VSAADGAEKRENGIGRRGQISENSTSEADLEEHINRIEVQYIVEVTADSGALSGLDKVATQPGEGASQEQGKIGESETETRSSITPDLALQRSPVSTLHASSLVEPALFGGRAFDHAEENRPLGATGTLKGP